MSAPEDPQPPPPASEESPVAPAAPAKAAAPAASPPTAAGPPEFARGTRPPLFEARAPITRECRGYLLRLESRDLARLRELPGARGKTDEQLGEEFFDGQAERLAATLLGDVPVPAEIRVVVDPFSRQAFLALQSTIRGIVSF